MGQAPNLAERVSRSLRRALARVSDLLHRLGRRVARQRRLRAVVTVATPHRLTRSDTLGLRLLGFVPSMAGAEEPDPAADPRTDGDPPRADPDPPRDGEETFPRDYVERLRRENANLRNRMKDATELARGYETKLRAHEDKDKSELELAIARAEAAEKERDEARAEASGTSRELWRYRAAAKHSVPEDLVDLIGGDTEEETLERAARLGTRIASSAEPGRRTAPPSPPRGARREPAGPSVDEQLAAAEKAGDWAAVARLSLAKQSTKE